MIATPISMLSTNSDVTLPDISNVTSMLPFDLFTFVSYPSPLIQHTLQQSIHMTGTSNGRPLLRHPSKRREGPLIPETSGLPFSEQPLGRCPLLNGQ